MIRPPGGHAVYLDARAPRTSARVVPGHRPRNALYETGGIHNVETDRHVRREAGRHRAGPMDLVRPRSSAACTQSHVDYVAEVVLSRPERPFAAGLPHHVRPARLRHSRLASEPIAT